YGSEPAAARQLWTFEAADERPAWTRQIARSRTDGNRGLGTDCLDMRLSIDQENRSSNLENKRKTSPQSAWSGANEHGLTLLSPTLPDSISPSWRRLRRCFEESPTTLFLASRSDVHRRT